MCADASLIYISTFSSQARMTRRLWVRWRQQWWWWWWWWQCLSLPLLFSGVCMHAERRTECKPNEFDMNLTTLNLLDPSPFRFFFLTFSNTFSYVDVWVSVSKCVRCVRFTGSLTIEWKYFYCTSTVNKWNFRFFMCNQEVVATIFSEQCTEFIDVVKKTLMIGI